jgi:D-xylose transport system substrate-binding protein
MLRSTTKQRLAVSVLAAGLALVAGCSSTSVPTGGSASTAGSTASGGATGKVALLLPESKTARYEARDKPTFTKALAAACASCELLYYNADQDANKQLSQAQSALTNGAKVLVIDPVDSSAAASIVSAAKAQNAKVISYDRVVLNADLDYAVKFDNVAQGKAQATSLVEKLRADGKTSGSIVMINGSSTDANSAPLKQGAHSVLDSSGYKIAAQYDTPDWSPDKAQNEMQQAITKLGAANMVGVYVANDGMASGAIAALKSAGVKPLPPVTGLDAGVDSIQRIIAGDQYQTTYLNVEQEATTAAKLAAAVISGASVSDLVGQSINNGSKDVPAVLLKPTSVTMSNLKAVIIDSGYLTVSAICTGDYVKACTAAGLS